jgi:cytochrome P450
MSTQAFRSKKPGRARVAPASSLIWQSDEPGAPERFFQSISLAWKMLAYRATCYVFCHLTLLKFAFNFIRPLRPVSLFGKLMVLTKAADIREALARFNDFALGEVIEPGMPWGPFIMTVDWQEQHRAERGLLQSAVIPWADEQRISDIVKDECRARLHRTGDQLDAVADFAEPVVIRIIAKYFGVSPVKSDLRLMARALRDLAGIIMVNPPVGSGPWINSRDSIAAVTAQILAQMDAAADAMARSKAARLPDTLLTRLVGLLRGGGTPDWFDEDWIRRYLTGLVGTGGATIVRGFTQALDQLICRPDFLKQARVIAARLDEEEAKGLDATAMREALRLYIYEALRFRPMLPLLVRDAPRDTIIAGSTPRARLVPGGTRVLASPLAAMFDPADFPQPNRFNPERPKDRYIHFGHGLRECFGRHIADIALLEMTRALLRVPHLESAGKGIQFEGPAPSSFLLGLKLVQPERSKRGS